MALRAPFVEAILSRPRAYAPTPKMCRGFDPHTHASRLEAALVSFCPACRITDFFLLGVSYVQIWILLVTSAFPKRVRFFHSRPVRQMLTSELSVAPVLVFQQLGSCRQRLSRFSICTPRGMDDFGATLEQDKLARQLHVTHCFRIRQPRCPHLGEALDYFSSRCGSRQHCISAIKRRLGYFRGGER